MKIYLTTEEAQMLEKLLIEELEYNIKTTADLSIKILFKLLELNKKDATNI